jgi:phospholipase C
MFRRRTLAVALAASAAIAASVTAAQVAGAHTETGQAAAFSKPSGAVSRTPIQHVVVIFQENISFDHYFGTYPNAANTDGQHFSAFANTPAVDGLLPATASTLPPSMRHAVDLTKSNPNSALPQRLDSSAIGLAAGPGGQLTCDQDHDYSDEQQAFDGGLMNRFVESVGTGSGTSPFGAPCQKALVMDYYDGNTVTALWNYAQHYAMSDNSYGTTFGPSSPGAINLVSGDTGGVDATHMVNSPGVSSPSDPNEDLAKDGLGGFSLTSDAQPYWDDCSTRDAVAMSGKNIGDALNAAGLSWGWFEGGFRPSISFADALAATKATGQKTSTFIPDQFKTAGFQNLVPHSSNQGICDTVHPVGIALGGHGQWKYKDDYIPHHEPFQYYASTANPHHLTIPTDNSGHDTLAGLEQIGTDTQTYTNGVPQFDTPNHNYDTSDFDQLVSAIGKGDLPPSALPAVSFLKAPGWQDGHGAYSDPADEQAFIVSEINALMRTPDWPHTAIVIAYDDSDGWYDHANPGVVNPSLSAADNLTNTTLSGDTSGQCGPSPQTTAPLAGEQGRCGFGPRMPLLVISPFTKVNTVDHNVSDQASIINFVEYNWGLPGIAGSADQVLRTKDASEGAAFDLAGLFHLHGEHNQRLILDPVTGQPVHG